MLQTELTLQSGQAQKCPFCSSEWSLGAGRRARALAIHCSPCTSPGARGSLGWLHISISHSKTQLLKKNNEGRQCSQSLLSLGEGHRCAQSLGNSSLALVRAGRLTSEGQGEGMTPFPKDQELPGFVESLALSTQDGKGVGFAHKGDEILRCPTMEDPQHLACRR